jgi:hypothetical protein
LSNRGNIMQVIKPSRKFYFIPAIIAIVGFAIIIYTFINLSTTTGKITTEKLSGEQRLTLKEERYYLLVNKDYDYLYAREDDQGFKIIHDIFKTTAITLTGIEEISIHELSSQESLTINNYKAMGYFDIEEAGEYTLKTSGESIDMMITNIGGSTIVGFVLLILITSILTVFGTTITFIFIYVKRSKSKRNLEIDEILVQQNQLNL